ncbi:MAG: YdjY domain-containing protein [Desulfuromonadaceae bacterium]|nr:YdjY domain-containing protein [Desulfuromonadaceae bacterium]
MKMARVLSGSLILIVTVFCINSLAIEAPPSPAPVFIPGVEGQSERIPPIEKLGNGEFRLGEIVVNKVERAITFPAQVNMDRGMLEYLIVHNKGKTHESLLRTLIDPYNLQIAFMLLGFEGTDQRLAMQGDPAPPKGERIQIYITAADGTKSITIPAEQWLINKIGEDVKDVKTMSWVFSGSYVDDGRFMSSETGSIAAIWHDPVAMIDNASPGGESNRIWFVKQGTVPPVGTPVKVTIKPAK